MLPSPEESCPVKTTLCSLMCTELAPQVFALNDDRQSEVRNPAGDTLDHILKAAENCPVGAITVEDVETGKQLFPVRSA